jgi:hypothetical protein
MTLHLRPLSELINIPILRKNNLWYTYVKEHESKGVVTMTEQLRHAIEAMQRLPDEAQNAIAARILEEIEEQEWDAIVSKPRVQARLRELGRQALEEDRVGETEDGGFDCQ